MFIHDVLKMRYAYDGYLENFPYHMLSDKEMIFAFMGKDDTGFFYDNYPRLIETETAFLRYNSLRLTIGYHLAMYLVDADRQYIIPDWVYSYMLGSTISVNSDNLDIHDLCVQLGVHESVDTFTSACSQACLDVSTSCLGANASIDYIDIPEKYKADMEDVLKQMSLYEWYHSPIVGEKICKRPPTMFGEPHVLKALRLRQAI